MSGNETFICSECGRNIPELNRTIHKLRCQGKETRAAAAASDATISFAGEDMDLDEIYATAMSAAAGTSQSSGLPVASLVTPASAVQPTAPELQHWECPACTCHNLLDTSVCQACGNVNDMCPVVGPNPNPAASAVAGSKWVCDMCTFENNHTGVVCEICSNERVRPPDASVRERLVPDDSYPSSMEPEPPRRPSVEYSEESSNDPFSAMATGAMIGGIFGGFAALLGGNQNRSVMSGVIQGAAMGGLSTSLLSDMGATFTTTRSSTGPGGTTTTTTRTGPGGTRTTTTRRTRAARSAGTRQNPGQPGAQTLNFEEMMRLVFAQQGMATVDTDGMSYEQLLARFGFGTDSRAADERVINSLQTETLKEDSVDSDGTSDACSICLEPLLKGEEATKLSCSHSYHTNCINEWLRNVGNCPVCKHAV